MALFQPNHVPFDDYSYKCDSNHVPIIRWTDYWKSSFIPANIIKCEHLETFKCSICQCYPRDPIKVSGCGHIFCRRCAFSRFTKDCFSTHCAICKCSYHYWDIPLLKEADEKLYTQYNSALISCVHGCGKVASPSKIQRHEYWKCELREVVCAFKECRDIMKQSELAAHVEDCEYRYIYCDLCEKHYMLEYQHELCKCSDDHSHDENGHPFYRFKSSYDWYFVFHSNCYSNLDTTNPNNITNLNYSLFIFNLKAEVIEAR